MTFKSDESASKAILKSGQDLLGRWVKVNAVHHAAKPKDCSTIFVGGLPFDVDEQTIRTFFQDCGEISEIRWGEDKRTGDFKGFCHVEFKESSATEKAVALSGTNLMGRRLRVDYAAHKEKSAASPRRDGHDNKGVSLGSKFRELAQSSDKPAGCTTVFCGNLAFDMDDQSLRQVMSKCGEIQGVRMATDRETGRFKGFAHVEFVESDATDKAVAMSGNEVMGRPIRIDYAKDKIASFNTGSPGRGGFGDGGRGRGGYGRSMGGRGGYSGGRQDTSTIARNMATGRSVPFQVGL